MLRIDFAGGNFSDPDELQNNLENMLRIWEKKYNINYIPKTLSDRFKKCYRNSRTESKIKNC